MKFIPLTKGLETIVDDEDFEELNKFKWFAKKGGDSRYYATRNVRIGNKVQTIRMHRFIMNCPVGKEVHHKNRNRLDNRRSNLQTITKSENARLRWKE